MVTRREERQEGEVHVENDGSRAQTTPLPGMRPAPLSEVAGPQAAVTVGYVAAGPPSLVVVLVSDMIPPPRCFDLFLVLFALGNLDIFPVVLPGVRYLGVA